MKELFGSTLVAVGVIGSLIVGLFVFALAGPLLNVGVKSIIMPMEEEVRQETWKRSTAHVEGTVEQIESLHMRYYSTDSASLENAIEGRLIRKYNELHPDDRDAVSVDVRELITQLKAERTQ